jgi:hypothetical protein
MITACESFISLETGSVLGHAANEAAVKKKQTNPVTARFNFPRFPRSSMIPRLKRHSS